MTTAFRPSIGAYRNEKLIEIISFSAGELPTHLVYCRARRVGCLSQTPRLSLPFQQAQNVALPDGPLHVANNTPVGVVQKLHAHLRDATGVARAAEHTVHLRQLYSTCFSLQHGGNGWVVTRQRYSYYYL